jgi:8-amino-7-oxononanoate synthase
MLIWRLIAIIICSPLTRLYLINYARPLIFTTFMSYPALAAIRASYTFMAGGATQKVILTNGPSLFQANNLR